MNQSNRVHQIRSSEGTALRDIRLPATADMPDAFAVSLAYTLTDTNEGCAIWATRGHSGTRTFCT